MEITKRNLVLTFATPSKTQETITISNPKEVLSGVKIKETMTAALATNAIGETVQATSIVDAKYVIQQVDAVDFEEA
ncbi:MAG: DUF2922 family protein [Niameybacter sp.]|uniref:DUF2922 family protein n=1 Tax=Niameybacter sp. TaxID=2033640 RepID=UPI002FCB3066